jgi:DNA adenine methylase
VKPLHPYFGGKRRAAAEVWAALGNVSRYVEPFLGSGAVLLASPHRPLSELVNDRDHHIANLWRSLQRDPDEVWRVASAPCSEVELRARHAWLAAWQAPDLSDLDACDPYAAGVWLWVACVAIGGDSRNLSRGNHGNGAKAAAWTPQDWRDVVDRIARVQVLCGDWSRCVTSAALALKGNVTDIPRGVFLDPPYGEGGGVAYEDGTGNVARDVWAWAVEHGDNPKLRIVVAGYDDGREIPDGWRVVERTENGGLGNASGNGNRHRERLWCSPHCLGGEQAGLL